MTIKKSLIRHPAVLHQLDALSVEACEREKRTYEALDLDKRTALDKSKIEGLCQFYLAVDYNY